MLEAILFGAGLSILCAVASRIFLDTKDRQEERKLQNWKF